MENEETKKDEALQEESALLKAYKELQENSVSKEEYNKAIKELKEKNDIYLKAITEGKKVDTSQDEGVSLEDRIKKLTKFKGTNLDFWKEMSPAIDSLIKSMPENEITKITGSEGLEELIKVNEGMKKMVEDADGDPDYFRSLYKQRVQDSAPRISAEIEKAGSLSNYLCEQNNKK